MRAVVQRVTASRVVADGVDRGGIGLGLNILVGMGKRDTDTDIQWLVDKIVNLRVFDDADGKMNLSVGDVGGSLLIVSQFTLYGDCRKGRRPSYDASMPPALAREMYDRFVGRCVATGIPCVTGVFSADMSVTIENDGPVTLLLDSERLF